LQEIDYIYFGTTLFLNKIVAFAYQAHDQFN